MFALLFLAMTASPSPAPSVPADAAVIVNSGSTNTAPYRIVLRPDGSARIEVRGEAAQTKKLSDAGTKAFFADLHAAAPLDGIKTEPCAKSASFGTSTFVRYRGVQSPDLSCASSGPGQRLFSATGNITAELGVSALRRYDGERRAPEPAPSSPAPRS